MNEYEIDQMVKDAEKHSEEDKEKKTRIENRNKLDQLAYQLEKLLKENKDKIPESMQSEVEEAVKKAQDAVRSEDDARITQEIENITNIANKLSQELYKAGTHPCQQPGPEGAKAGGEGPKSEPTAEEGEVIDA